MKPLALAWIVPATVLLLHSLTGSAQVDAASTTAFTYQGFLQEDGIPAHGSYGISFELIDALTRGPILDPVTNLVDVVQGVFTVKLDFGPIFDDRPVALQIAVELQPDVFVPLDPPQAVCAAPRAMHALVADLAETAGTALSVPDESLSDNVPLLVNQVLLLTNASSRLAFGPLGESSIGLDPTLSGLVERDPVGLRLLGAGDLGGRLIIGPTMDSTIEVDPQGPSGLVLRDPNGVRIVNPDPTGSAKLLFGTNDLSSIAASLPLGPPGLVLSDPGGLRIVNPDTNSPSLLRFGGDPDDLCTIGIDPRRRGIAVNDPGGLRIVNPDTNSPSLLRFGGDPDDLCTIGIDPTSPGINFSDPNGFRFTNPNTDGPVVVRFGPTDDCRIGIEPSPLSPIGASQMVFSDVNGFAFVRGDVSIEGAVTAAEFIQTSSRRFKENIRPIESPLEHIKKLTGVRFDWRSRGADAGDIGFIAEDVADVLPEVVAWEADGENAKGVNYGHLVAVTVEGIKAQQAEIDELRRENAALNARLDRLERSLPRED